jgi:hypothetical protein
MPHVLVQHTDEFLKWGITPKETCKHFKKHFRAKAAEVLSVPDRELGEDDFSFMFLEAGPHDELIHDIQVIVLAHADEERVSQSDELARYLNEAVEKSLRASWWQKLGESPGQKPKQLTFSVSLSLSEMGYHANWLGNDGSSERSWK